MNKLYTNWREVKLVDIGVFLRGFGISKKDLSDSGTPAIRYGNIYTKYDFIIKNISSFTNSKGTELKKGDIIVSGESVWIKQALYFAFSVIRTKNTGFCFKTRFLDESDSELDSESRPRFVKMIETAHKMCNATLTILITHSVEVKDLINQKIELKAD